MLRHLGACVCLLLLWGAGGTRLVYAQPVADGAGGRQAKQAYLDVSIEAATQLRTAASYMADENWSEALDVFEKMIQDFGDKVVQAGDSSVYINVRDYCHAQILRMPTDVIAQYRRRVDGQAEKWYRAGVAERDEKLLRRVVDFAFCSSWGDDALDALAELAFEAGRFDEAYSLLARIDTTSPQQSGGSSRDPPGRLRLLYPDTDLNRPLLEARKIICRVFLGRRDQAARELAAFRRHYPDAQGRLGNDHAPLAELLSKILLEPPPAEMASDEQWLTFAGNAQRSKVMPEGVEVGSVQWTAPLPGNFRRTRMRPSVQLGRNSLSYHPLVVRDWVLVCGWDEVYAYDLHEGPKDGKPVWSFSLYGDRGYARAAIARATIGSPHYTMTAEGRWLYVRLGAPETTMPRRIAVRRPETYIVCLDLEADGKELWRIQPDQPELAFEGGAPVVAGGNLYVALTRGGAMTQTFVACYDAATGAKKWQRLICEASSPTTYYQASITHNLLTLGAGMVFYNTNLGALAALDAASGQVRWIATYTRSGITRSHRREARDGREVNPCVYHDGLVIALPRDGRGVYAFDAASGQLIWKLSEPPYIKHLLGVAHGNLICTGDREVVAVDVSSGRKLWQWPDGQGLQAYGRGILAGNLVYFPTRTSLGGEIYVLDQTQGQPAKPSVALTAAHGQVPGNLVVGNGYLVMANAKGLTVFCEYDILINRYRDLIAHHPTKAEPHFRLARAAEASSDHQLAVKHYRAAIRLAQPGERVEQRSVHEAAAEHLYGLMFHFGREAEAGKQWVEAERNYQEAAGAAPNDQKKLEVLLAIGEMWRSAEEPEKALVAYQHLLAQEPLRELSVQVEPRRLVRADVWITAQVEDLVEQHGQAIYARFDVAARELFGQAKESGSLATVERLLSSYPAAQVVPDVLLYLATERASRKQLAAARLGFQRLLTRGENPPEIQLAGLYGLAQVHEAQQEWQVALQTWKQLAREFPEFPSPNDPQQTVATFLREHMGRAPYRTGLNDQAEDLQFPLSRRWRRSWGPTRRVVLPDGAAPVEGELTFLVSGSGVLECIRAATGKVAWRMQLDAPVRWAAFHKEQLLVGTASALLSVGGSGGQARWQYKISPVPEAHWSHEPAKRATRHSPPDHATRPAEFKLVGDRVFLREGSRQLTCLSADNGQALWSYSPTEGTLAGGAFFSSQRVALRTKEPGKFVVLDSDGRCRFELLAPEAHRGFSAAPLDVNRLCVATGPRSVQLIDLVRGSAVWSYLARSNVTEVRPIVGPGGLFVLADGTDLVRLDPETGRPLWSAHVADRSISHLPNSWALDDQHFYCVTPEHNLRSFRLEDGTERWWQHLTGKNGRWQIKLTSRYVVAFPPSPSLEGLPLVFCRRSDGRLVQRLLFRPRGKSAVMHLSSSLALVGSEQELWAVGSVLK